MPNAQLSNPLGINAAQGNEVYSAPLIVPFATDPAANSHAITGMSTANPTVITTAAHGYISGQQVNINASVAYSATGTVPNGNYVCTVLSATTFSIPYNYTGTYTSGGGSFQNFQPGQLAILQNWTGAASSDAAASTYPTIGITPLTTASKAQVGVIIGYNTLGGAAPPPVPGQNTSFVAQVQTQGLCQVYVDSTTSSSPTNLGASVATPGAGKTLTATTGLNIGIILQNVTVTSAYLPQLAWCFVRLS